jgi:hypothetical protein
MSEVELFDYGDDKQAARKRATEIKRHLKQITYYAEKLPRLIIEARERGDDKWLGYPDWPSYVREEYGTYLLKLDVKVRRSITADLKGHGFTSRQIAAVVNVNQSTVVRDANASRPKRAASDCRSASRAATRTQPDPPADLAEVVDAEVVDDATDADALIRMIAEFIDGSGKDELMRFRLALSEALKRCVARINGKEPA